MSDLPSGMGDKGGEMLSGMGHGLGGSATLQYEHTTQVQAAHFSAASLENRGGELPSGTSGAVLATAPRPFRHPVVTTARRLLDAVGPVTSLSWKKRPKVSVLTCSYNRPDLLRAAVESLFSQTDGDWEQLICDDASTNPRVEETLRWAEQDPRVRVWRCRKNVDAPSILWNFMLERAHGRYISILDDDNEKLQRFIEAMSGRLEVGGLGFVTCGTVNIRRGQRDAVLDNMLTSVGELERRNTCDGGSILYKRELFGLVGSFSEDIRTNEDYDLLRRAARSCDFDNLGESLASYRNEDQDRRMSRVITYGDLRAHHDADIAAVMSREIRTNFDVRFVAPVGSGPNGDVTRSQRDAIGAMENGLRAVQGVSFGDGSDLVVIAAPFLMHDEEIKNRVGRCKRVLAIHVEDPLAIGHNISRAHALTEVSGEVWVCTNDVSTVSHYREIVGDRVMVCPMLGVDATVQYDAALERDIDVLFCGYGYESRRRFMADLLPQLKGKRVVLVGDNWHGFSVETMPTQPLAQTYVLHVRAKTVVCSQRQDGVNFNGSWLTPQSVNRGFMEGYFGPRVFIDDTRKSHSYDPGDVVWYSSAQDLAAKLHSYLDGPRDAAADRFAEKCALLYTYKARMERVINCIRSPRYLAEIP